MVSSPAWAADTVKIGVVAAVSGSFVSAGHPLPAGVGLAVSAGWSFPSALAAAVIAVALLGFLLERGLFRFTLDRPTNGFIVSLGLVVLLQHVVIFFFNGNQKSIPRPLDRARQFGSVRIAVTRAMVIGVTAAVVASTYMVVIRSRYGRALRASVEDRDTAMLMGTPVRRYIAGVFVLGSALAGLGGALLIGLFPVMPLTGGTIVMKGFAVVLIGGVGNVGGAAVA